MAHAKFSVAIKPYIEAEKVGRFLYQEIKQRTAEEMLAKSLVPDLSDWMM